MLNTGGCGCAHGLVRGSSRWGVPEVCGPTAGHGVLFVLFVCLLPSPLPPQSPRSVLWKQVLKSTGSPSGSLLVARPTFTFHLVCENGLCCPWSHRCCDCGLCSLLLVKPTHCGAAGGWILGVLECRARHFGLGGCPISCKSEEIEKRTGQVAVMLSPVLIFKWCYAQSKVSRYSLFKWKPHKCLYMCPFMSPTPQSTYKIFVVQHKVPSCLLPVCFPPL